MSRNTETSYSGQWEHTRQAFSPHHYQLNTMWSILLCCPPWPNGAYSLHCSLSVNRMDALGTTGLVAWRQPLQSQSCQTKILFHGLLTIHVHNYNISILWHRNFCCNFSACCTFSGNDIPCHECSQSCGNTSPSWTSAGRSGGPTDVLPCQKAPVKLPCNTWGRQMCCLSRRHSRGVDSGQVFGQLAWGQWMDHGSHK